MVWALPLREWGQVEQAMSEGGNVGAGGPGTANNIIKTNTTTVKIQTLQLEGTHQDWRLFAQSSVLWNSWIRLIQTQFLPHLNRIVFLWSNDDDEDDTENCEECDPLGHHKNSRRDDVGALLLQALSVERQQQQQAIQLSSCLRHVEFRDQPFSSTTRADSGGGPTHSSSQLHYRDMARRLQHLMSSSSSSSSFVASITTTTSTTNYQDGEDNGSPHNLSRVTKRFPCLESILWDAGTFLQAQDAEEKKAEKEEDTNDENDGDDEEEQDPRIRLGSCSSGSNDSKNKTRRKKVDEQNENKEWGKLQLAIAWVELLRDKRHSLRRLQFEGDWQNIFGYSTPPQARHHPLVQPQQQEQQLLLQDWLILALLHAVEQAPFLEQIELNGGWHNLLRRLSPAVLLPPTKIMPTTATSRRRNWRRRRGGTTTGATRADSSRQTNEEEEEEKTTTNTATITAAMEQETTIVQSYMEFLARLRWLRRLYRCYHAWYAQRYSLLVLHCSGPDEIGRGKGGGGGRLSYAREARDAASALDVVETWYRDTHRPGLLHRAAATVTSTTVPVATRQQQRDSKVLTQSLSLASNSHSPCKLRKEDAPNNKNDDNVNIDNQNLGGSRTRDCATMAPLPPPGSAAVAVAAETCTNATTVSWKTAVASHMASTMVEEDSHDLSSTALPVTSSTPTATGMAQRLPEATHRESKEEEEQVMADTPPPITSRTKKTKTSSRKATRGSNTTQEVSTVRQSSNTIQDKYHRRRHDRSCNQGRYTGRNRSASSSSFSASLSASHSSSLSSYYWATRRSQHAPIQDQSKVPATSS